MTTNEESLTQATPHPDDSTYTIGEFCDEHNACKVGRDWALSTCQTMLDVWDHADPHHLLWIATRPRVLRFNQHLQLIIYAEHMLELAMLRSGIERLAQHNLTCDAMRILALEIAPTSRAVASSAHYAVHTARHARLIHQLLSRYAHLTHIVSGGENYEICSSLWGMCPHPNHLLALTPIAHHIRQLLRPNFQRPIISAMNQPDETSPQDDACDAKRYRWLREQHWDQAKLCVVLNPKEAVKLGRDCPALERLDTIIDESIR